MNKKAYFFLIPSLVLLGGMALWVSLTQAAPGATSLAGGSPTVVAYQGEVRMSFVPYTGVGYFKFAVVDAAGDSTYWSNDGSSTNGGEPTAAVPLVVKEGLFNVLLGDTTLAGMTQALTAQVFGQPDRYLRVWFNTAAVDPFDQLAPDTRIAAVPYALQAQAAVDADTVDGFHASELRTNYQNVVVVAQSGGDYTSVQAAIDSITDAGSDNPYLVWVAPGVYSETVTMKPYVHLQGAGQEATVITSAISDSGSDWPPTQATLLLASDTSLRDLTLGNNGTVDRSVALLSTAGMTRTLVADVTVRAQGGSVNNFAIFLTGSGTGVTLQGVTALAEDASNLNAGLINFSEAAALLYDGSYSARGGTNAWGIFLVTGTLEAHNVTALGENGSNLNSGLYNWNNSTAVLYGGNYTGRGGNQTGGAGAAHNSTLTAYGVTALAENGSGDVGNYAMGCYDNSTATLHGGVFIARGGVNNYALSNEDNVTMQAENVTALAENGSTANHGFWNVNNAQATVRSGDFTGRGGINAYGVYSADSGTSLDAEDVTALGESGSEQNYGLLNNAGSAAILRGGSFTARGGIFARGICNVESGTTLEANQVTALGEDGTVSNLGLSSNISATATLRGGSFTGSGGQSTQGIYNSEGATLEANGAAVLGENGSSNNRGLLNNTGSAATLRSGSFSARGGTYARGIQNIDSGTVLEAHGATALAENGGSLNIGFGNQGSATATLSGGSFTARDGIDTRGILNSDSDTILDAEAITVLAENGSSINIGLLNNNFTATTVHNSSFTARGGAHTRGIQNAGSGTLLEANSVTALAENASEANSGLYNNYYAAATLSESSFIALGGTYARGIQNIDSGTTLEAYSVTALAENGSSSSIGLYNYSAAATLSGGSFSARGGGFAHGVYNTDSVAVLGATNISALGEGGSLNYGLYNLNQATANITQSALEGATNSVYYLNGTVEVSNSRLVGGAVSSASVTCVLVTRGTTISTDGSTCP